MCRNRQRIGSGFLTGDADLVVLREHAFDSAPEIINALWSVDIERHGAASIIRRERRRRIEVGQPRDVIRVKMSDEYRRDIAQWHLGLMQPNGNTTPGIEKEPLRSGLHERAHPEAIDVENRRTGAEQRDGYHRVTRG